METTPFENLRSKLREAGCRVVIENQARSFGSKLTLLTVHPEASQAVRCIALDEGRDGYQLFIANPALTIDGDVQAILRADLNSRLIAAA